MIRSTVAAASASRRIASRAFDAPDVVSPEGSALLVIGDERQVPGWEAAIAETRDLGLTIALQVGVPARHLAARAFDAIVVDIAAGGGEALGWGISLLGRARAAEVVFFSEDSGAPEVAALRALRWPNLVVGCYARAWIVGALPILARVGRARRDLHRAQAEIPSLLDGGEEPSLGLPLSIAETRFREGYVRAILARQRNRAAAAKDARVPYRTFCKIIRKLGIEVSGT